MTQTRTLVWLQFLGAEPRCSEIFVRRWPGEPPSCLGTHRPEGAPELAVLQMRRHVGQKPLPLALAGAAGGWSCRSAPRAPRSAPQSSARARGLPALLPHPALALGVQGCGGCRGAWRGLSFPLEQWGDTSPRQLQPGGPQAREPDQGQMQRTAQAPVLEEAGAKQGPWACEAARGVQVLSKGVGEPLHARGLGC